LRYALIRLLLPPFCDGYAYYATFDAAADAATPPLIAALPLLFSHYAIY